MSLNSPDPRRVQSSPYTRQQGLREGFESLNGLMVEVQSQGKPTSAIWNKSVSSQCDSWLALVKGDWGWPLAFNIVWTPTLFLAFYVSCLKTLDTDMKFSVYCPRLALDFSFRFSSFPESILAERQFHQLSFKKMTKCKLTFRWVYNSHVS